MTIATLVIPVRSISGSAYILHKFCGFYPLQDIDVSIPARLVLVRAPNLCTLCLEQVDGDTPDNRMKPYLEYVIETSEKYEGIVSCFKDWYISKEIHELSGSMVAVFEHEGIEIHIKLIHQNEAHLKDKQKVRAL